MAVCWPAWFARRVLKCACRVVRLPQRPPRGARGTGTSARQALAGRRVGHNDSRCGKWPSKYLYLKDITPYLKEVQSSTEKSQVSKDSTWSSAFMARVYLDFTLWLLVRRSGRSGGRSWFLRSLL